MKKTFDQKEKKEQLMELKSTFDCIKSLSMAIQSEAFDQEERLDEKDYTLESINHQRNFASIIQQLANNGFEKSNYLIEKSEGDEK